MSIENDKQPETAVRCTSVTGGIVCNGLMRRGIAIPPAWQCSDDGTCSYANWNAVAPLVSVLKCERCGHSFMPPEESTPTDSPPANGSAVDAEIAMWSDVECDDEKHMAIALYLLQKAIALSVTEGGGYPTIHACLRDAAAHCEAARLHWTREAMERRREIARTIFGDDPQSGKLTASPRESPEPSTEEPKP